MGFFNCHSTFITSMMHRRRPPPPPGLGSDEMSVGQGMEGEKMEECLTGSRVLSVTCDRHIMSTVTQNGICVRHIVQNDNTTLVAKLIKDETARLDHELEVSGEDVWIHPSTSYLEGTIYRSRYVHLGGSGRATVDVRATKSVRVTVVRLAPARAHRRALR